MTEYWAAILIGLVGSLHCMGMCGPIALTVTKTNTGFSENLSRIFLYNSGRTITYAIFGLVAGSIGAIFNMAGLQQYLSVGFGILLIIGTIFAVNFDKLFHIPAFSFFLGKIKSKLSQLLNSSKSTAPILIGFLNGFLPCGLVYLGITGALATGSIFGGGLFMALFGLGTFPAMIATSSLGYVIGLKFRNTLKKTAPYLLFAVGVLFVLRGLDLNIPYLSPKLSDLNKAGTVRCH